MPPAERFTLYSHSEGNYFFSEIRDLLASGLKDLGMQVRTADEKSAFDSSDWHVVVAPHEFFFIGTGRALVRKIPKGRLILYTTEQTQTQWFSLSRRIFPLARALWECDAGTHARLRSEGLPASFVPLGYSPRCELFQPVKSLRPRGPLAHLSPAELRFAGNFQRRAVDLVFVGSSTPRREAALARLAPALAGHRCFLHLSDPSKPVTPLVANSLDSRLMRGLAQRAKIVLNLHRDQASYFERHRIVAHGIGQGALVLSEPTASSGPFVPGRDFIEATIEEMPALVSRFLRSAAGLREAERIAAAGGRTLRTRAVQSQLLEPALNELAAPARPPIRIRSHQRAAADLPQLLRREAARLPADKCFAGGRGGPRPRVTAAVTLFNYEKFIGPCLDSLRAQTMPALDLIVVDDASTDASLAACRRWLSRHGRRFARAELLSRPKNAGLAAARNLSFERARTEFVFVLDADNTLYPRALERLTAALDAADAAAAYSLLRLTGDETGLKNKVSWRPDRLEKGNMIDAMALFRKSAWKRLGGYRVQPVQGWEDFDLWLRLARSGGWAVHVPEILGEYRVHLRSMLHQETNPQAWRLHEHFHSSFGVRIQEESPAGVAGAPATGMIVTASAAGAGSSSASSKYLAAALAAFADAQKTPLKP